jgi:hypothetical protein
VALGTSGVQIGTVAPAGDINWAIADWRRLRQDGGRSFAEYARFLIYNPAWPGEAAMRRTAEARMTTAEAPATVLSFFAREKPQTGSGWAQLALALLANGRQAEALQAARQAWGSADLGADQETAIYALPPRDDGQRSRQGSRCSCDRPMPRPCTGQCGHASRPTPA